MTEREKLKMGFWYDANNDTELLEQREDAEELCYFLNQTSPKMPKKREEIMGTLLPNRGKDTTILSPFYTDYGYNCFIGPNCGMYTATHPLLSEERNQGLEKAKPITIGSNVWIGADVTILPGVTIGDNTVIGAKSVITKDIPSNVIAVGNPCRVLRKITEQDSIKEEMKREEKNIK